MSKRNVDELAADGAALLALGDEDEAAAGAEVGVHDQAQAGAFVGNEEGAADPHHPNKRARIMDGNEHVGHEQIHPESESTGTGPAVPMEAVTNHVPDVHGQQDAEEHGDEGAAAAAAAAAVVEHAVWPQSPNPAPDAHSHSDAYPHEAHHEQYSGHHDGATMAHHHEAHAVGAAEAAAHDHYAGGHHEQYADPHATHHYHQPHSAAAAAGDETMPPLNHQEHPNHGHEDQHHHHQHAISPVRGSHATRDDRWQDMYESLCAYKAEKGDCLVPGRYGKLGPWVQIQRAQYRLLKEGKPSSLTNDRVARLESVGFTWQILKGREECWLDMYNELLAYRDEHGHMNVPSTSKSHSKLGSWCKRQRMTHKLIREGKPSPMKAEWLTKLQEIGFDFEGGPKKRAAPTKDDDENFAQRLEEVRQFAADHGHCLIPEQYPTNEALGKWAAQKRKQKKRLEEGKSSKLSADRVKQLDDLGFVWQVWGNRTEKWEEMFQKCKVYMESHGGSTRVALNDTDNRKLGMWIDRQKTNYRLKMQGETSPMTDERIKRMEEIGFNWQITSRQYEADSWNKRLDELKAYKEAHGDCLVPRNYNDNQKLGRWVDHQRQQYRNMQKGVVHYMSKEKLKKLEDVGFAFTPPSKPTDRWSQYFVRLQAFQKANGHCRVPYIYPDDPGLGTWVETCRTQHKRRMDGRASRITDERVKMLTDLGFEWTLPSEDGAGQDFSSAKSSGRGSWETRFEELAAYKAEHGNCNVPNNYAQNKKLGSFVKKQREDYRLKQSGKHSPMNDDRIRRLNGIGFAWTVIDREYNHDSWSRRYEELKDFKTQNGHCFVPRQYPENQKLAYWVERQRQDYRNLEKGKPSKMTQDRIGILEEVGFHWSSKEQKALGIPSVMMAAKPQHVQLPSLPEGDAAVAGAQPDVEMDMGAAEAAAEAVAHVEETLNSNGDAVAVQV